MSLAGVALGTRSSRGVAAAGHETPEEARGFKAVEIVRDRYDDEPGYFFRFVDKEE